MKELQNKRIIKDDFVVVEGSDKLDDQRQPDNGIFHLQWQRYCNFNSLSVDVEEKEKKNLCGKEQHRNDLLHLKFNQYQWDYNFKKSMM